MKQPAWGRSREFETTTRTVSSTGAGSGKPNAVGGDEFQDFQDEDDQEDELTPGKQRMKVVFMPTFGEIVVWPFN
jgi:chaperone BCS1